MFLAPGYGKRRCDWFLGHGCAGNIVIYLSATPPQMFCQGWFSNSKQIGAITGGGCGVKPGRVERPGAARSLFEACKLKL
jgi:hypothetical protein